MTSRVILIEGCKKALENNWSDRMIFFRVQYEERGERFRVRPKNEVLHEY